MKTAGAAGRTTAASPTTITRPTTGSRVANGGGDQPYLRPELDPATPLKQPSPAPPATAPAVRRSVPRWRQAGMANSPETAKRPKEPLSILGEPPIRCKHQTG